jgi:hypothetical protein
VPLFVLLVSIILGAIRVAGVTGSPFQDLAHVWVGGLFGAWLLAKSTSRMPYTVRFFRGLAIGMTVLEVLCFAASPKGQALIHRLI